MVRVGSHQKLKYLNTDLSSGGVGRFKLQMSWSFMQEQMQIEENKQMSLLEIFMDFFLEIKKKRKKKESYISKYVQNHFSFCSISF